VFVWRECPHASGFLLGVILTGVLALVVMLLVLRQLIVGIGTLPPGAT
jgi:hypothetical protein